MDNHNRGHRRIVSVEDEAIITQWLKDHVTEYNSRAELVAAAFNTVLVGKRQPKISSSTVYRYTKLAGVAKSSDKVVEDESPLSQIRRAEQLIRDALLSIDAERDRLMARIKELDDTAAKYRKAL